MSVLDFLNKSSGVPWLGQRAFYVVRSGSHAYGTNIASSDEDFKGIAVPPKEYFIGFNKRFEQAEFHDPDAVIYDIRKFMNLAVDCNPNIIEMLFVDEGDVLITSHAGGLLRGARDLFLSKKAKHTFSGYAVSQLKRIQGHYRWLKSPPTKKPERCDFGLPDAKAMIPPSERDNVEAAIKKYTDSHRMDLSQLDDTVRIQALRAVEDYMAEIGVGTFQQTGIDPLWAAGAKTLGLTDVMTTTLLSEKKYSVALKEYQQYESWKLNRNEKRAAIEERYGYDCYTDDTEFLTADGWKLFDDVTSTDSLATVSKNDFKLEYQKPTQRFDGTFNGNLHRFHGNHLEVTVTPNHRMLYRKVERASGKEYGWGLEEAAGVPDSFDFRIAIAPNTKNFSDVEHYKGQPLPPVAYATLMGWYLSDGTMAFRDGVPRSIRISQKKGGKLSWKMARFASDYANMPMSLYEYARPPNAFNSSATVERVLDIRDKTVVAKMYADCGHGSFVKRIPRWMFGQSKRVMEKLLFALIGGDGTVRPTGLYIYYSAHKKLADDVQELAFMCGWETSLYGPYAHNGIDMYQVHLNDKAPNTKRLVRNQNLELVPVLNQRIVCFSVPNGILVTRKKGHIAIQGNCKHGMHLVRLMRMAREILSGKGVIVRRPDAEELLDIRNGAWKYEDLIEWAEKQEKELEELYRTSTLPNSPDRQKADELCQRIVEDRY